MDTSFYIITWTDVFVSLILILITFILLSWWKIGITKSLIWGTVRSFVQLTIMGYVLTFFFRQHHWTFMVGLLILMSLIASYEGYRRLKDRPIPFYFLILFGSLLITLIIVLGTILQFILDVKPWYYPYAMIPIAGMIIGNALNSTTLTINRFTAELEHREGEMEMMLSLGAPVRFVVEGSIRAAIRAALLPVLNSMMMVGLVQIPGVMTGQILAGIDPIIAVRYQIMIMYMWVTSAALTDILVLAFVYRAFFTSNDQIKYDLVRKGNQS